MGLNATSTVVGIVSLIIHPVIFGCFAAGATIACIGYKITSDDAFRKNS
jgi:hypothetical protein